MSKVFIPAGYHSCLSLYDTQKAISLIKRVFEDTLCGNLNLSRVSAPLFVEASTGLNDDLMEWSAPFPLMCRISAGMHRWCTP